MNLTNRQKLLAGLLLVVGFVSPPWTIEQDRFRHVIVFDITQSMNVADLRVDGRPVSRLEEAKREATEAIADPPCGSEVGIALFTVASGIVPLITDLQLARSVVEALRQKRPGSAQVVAWNDYLERAPLRMS